MTVYDIREAAFLDGGVSLSAVGDVFRPSGGGGPFPRAVHFDGVGTVLYRTTALTGVSDSATGTLSSWFKAPAFGNGAPPIFAFCTALNGSSLPDVAAQTSGFSAQTANTGVITLPTDSGNQFGWGGFLQNAAATANLSVDGGGLVLNATSRKFDNAWHHILMSWNTNFPDHNYVITSLSSNALVGDTVIHVTAAGGLAIGDTINIRLNGTGNVYHSTTVDNVAGTAITLHVAMPFAAASTNVVQHQTAGRIYQICLDGSLVNSFIEEGSSTGAAFTLNCSALASVIGCYGFTGDITTLGTPFEFDVTELYINFATHLDLSNSANVAKFRNPSTGKPVDLGATGSIPTGVAPAIYQSIPATGAASQFAANNGTGGAYTIGGTLVRATTDPF